MRLRRWSLSDTPGGAGPQLPRLSCQTGAGLAGEPSGEGNLQPVLEPEKVELNLGDNQSD